MSSVFNEPNRYLCNHKAFTLVELLIVIAIIGIILTISFPSWHSFIIRNKVAARIDVITNALQLARTEAITSGKNIKFCKSKDLKQCCASCAWRDGQIIITNDNKLINVFAPLPVGDKLIWQGNFGNNDFLEFSPDGFVNGQRGSFYYCSKKDPHSEEYEYAMAIIIQHTGHIRVSNRTADGKTIPCMEDISNQ